ncbi:mechanosensitive ion channel family protein [Pedobacter duraquae]|nr:mechanosensitive ion channel domain-containing protein [Pedobacter duraquae]
MLKLIRQPSYLITLILFSLTGILHAQTATVSTKKTPIEKEVLLIKSNGTDTSINTFITKVEYYSNSFNSMTSLLAKGFDTVEISRQLPRIDSLLKFIKGGNSVNDRSNTLRSLYVIRDILTHQEDQLSEWQATLAGYNTRLVQIQSNLIQIKEDRALSYVPADSLLKDEYREQMDGLNRKWKRMDASNRKVMRQIGLLQSLVVQNYINVTNYKERVNTALRNFGKRAFSEEYPYLWQSGRSDYAKSFGAAYDKTISTNEQLLDYFVSANWPVHIWCLLIFAGFYGWTLYTTRKIRNENEDRDTVLNQAHYIPRNTLLSALVVAFLLGTFLYDHPPVVFVELMMLVVLISTGLLIRKVWPAHIFKFWMMIVLLSIVSGISNLFLLASYTDRIVIFILGIVGSATGYLLLKTVRAKEAGYPPKTVLLLQIFIGLQSLSVLANLFGRFSLAKILLVTSLFGLWQALSLVVFVRVIMEAVFLQLEASKENDGVPTYFDFQGLQQRFKTALNVVAIVLWLILLAGNLNILDSVYDFLSGILTQPRKIGETAFTFGSVIIFLIIIYVASLISKAITYFFEFADFHSSSQTRKNKLSSSILLVKLGIFSVGFLLAIAASGIPIERITIILGALSVGIGFGLQTIVNNLVSGIILAIEKPVQIGDLIEIGTRSGTVKSMGIRASKIATSDGSEVIVPNGDLLSQHLVNWTLSDKHRRVELIIGVTYGSDLNRVLALLRGIVDTRDDIMHDPAAMVLIHNFGPSSVDFRILFWVPEIGNWLTLKSQVLSDIYEVFYREGIEMPFPQTDVHLHYPENQDKLPEERKDTEATKPKTSEPTIDKL